MRTIRPGWEIPRTPVTPEALVIKTAVDSFVARAPLRLPAMLACWDNAMPRWRTPATRRPRISPIPARRFIREAQRGIRWWIGDHLLTSSGTYRYCRQTITTFGVDKERSDSATPTRYPSAHGKSIFECMVETVHDGISIRCSKRSLEEQVYRHRLRSRPGPLCRVRGPAFQ